MKALKPEIPTSPTVLPVIIDMQEASGVDCQIIWDDTQTLFYPILPCIVEELTIVEKSLELSAETRYVRQSVRRSRALFATFERDDKRIGVTFQGFLNTIIKALVSNGKTFSVRDIRLADSRRPDFPEPDFAAMGGFRFSQRELLESALIKNKSGLIGAPTRYGKCLGINELCLKYDYTMVRAADVKEGDLLMGPDGLPRRVTGCIRGIDPMYRITPNKGEPFTCNEDHILSLKVYLKDRCDTVNISVKDYLAASTEFKQNAYLYYAPAHCNERELKIPPEEMGIFVAEHPDVITNIPIEYLTCGYMQRASFLRGFRGASAKYKVDEVLYVRVASKTIANDLIRLCHGMGLSCCKELRADITGEESWFITFPENVKRTFSVEYIGEGEYAGFELKGPDHLFLMWDHLVTHNTTLMVNTLKAFPTLSSVVVAPGIDLVTQLYEDLTGPRGVKNREVKLICSGKGRKQSQEPNGITVCSADSLHLCDPGSTELLLADEPHALVTSTRISTMDGFLKARRYGYGATLKGRFDGRDKLITGIFGPVLAERTYLEAVREGAICPLNIIMFQVELTPHDLFNRDTAYNELLFQNVEMANLLKRICEEVIPTDWQTLIFIKNEAQADLYLDIIGHEHTIAMAKKMTKKEREEITTRMKANEIKRCLCTDIYVQGVTFSDSRVLINCEAGGNNTTAIQKPGRLAEIRPGKNCGIIIDFEFIRAAGYSAKDYEGDQTGALIADSRNRLKAYKEKGYGIYKAKTIEETKQIFDSLI